MPAGWGTRPGAKDARPGGEEGSPWTGRVLGVMLLVLALAAIYHGSAGRMVWQDLSRYLATRSPQAEPASRFTVEDVQPPLAGAPAALGTLGAAVSGFVGDVAAGDWPAARGRLSAAEAAWLNLAPNLAQDGVPALELNTFTTLLADAQARVADRDRAAAAADARSLDSELGVLTVAWVGSQAPTYVELKALVQDLGTGVARHSWPEVAQDAADLRMLVARVGQGF